MSWMHIIIRNHQSDFFIFSTKRRKQSSPTRGTVPCYAPEFLDRVVHWSKLHLNRRHGRRLVVIDPHIPRRRRRWCFPVPVRRRGGPRREGHLRAGVEGSSRRPPRRRIRGSFWSAGVGGWTGLADRGSRHGDRVGAGRV
jgi:hypothetical protein